MWHALSKLKDSGSMMSRYETKTHEGGAMFAKRWESKSLGKVISFVLSGANGKEDSNAFTDKSLERESFEGDNMAGHSA